MLFKLTDDQERELVRLRHALRRAAVGRCEGSVSVREALRRFDELAQLGGEPLTFESRRWEVQLGQVAAG